MRFHARTASSCLLLLAVTVGATASVGCTKEQPKPDDTAQAKRAPEAVPSDFVLNDFFPTEAGAPGAAAAGSGAPGNAAPPGDPGAAMAAGNPAPPAHAGLKVIDPGADPKVQRRYNPKIGKTDTLKVTLQTTLTREQGGQKGSMPQPAMMFTMAVTAKDKAADGSFDFDLKLIKADVAPAAATDPPQAQQMAQQMSMALKQLAGTNGTFKIDPHGSLGAFALNPTGGAGGMGAEAAGEVVPLIQQALEAMLVVFPDDAIGKGGHWTETAQSNADGVATSVVTDSVLTDIAGDDLTITVQTTRKAPPQAVPDPRAPKGTMLSVNGAAMVTVHTPLTRLVKSSKGESQTHVTVVEPAGAGQPPQTSSQLVAVKQSVEAS